MNVSIPRGFRLAGVHCGIKANPEKQDLALIAAETDCAAAGVYTQNLVFAAPVALDRSRTPNANCRAIVVNSGNANACTGERGLADAKRTAELVAAALGVEAEQVLALSTGVIGRFLPMEKIGNGIQQAAQRLGNDAASLVSAARGMLTTDTRHKVAGRTWSIRGQEARLIGLAKGAAMIGPNMATMLGVILTDVQLTPAAAQRALAEAVDRSFNCISVEGHMSTNDTVLLLASGQAGVGPLSVDEMAVFQANLNDLCAELARSIPDDGEGTTHLVTIDIRGAASRQTARQIAKTIAESALVKTAIAGADPNWGRIVSAVGYAGVPVDISRLELHLNGHLLYQNGTPIEFDAAQVSQTLRQSRETSIEINLAEGDADIRFWTTDLTAEYVRLNADYTT